MAITYTTVTNPVYSKEDHSMIDLTVNFDHLPEDAVQFGACANDVEPHGRELYQRAVAGDFGTIGAYVAPDTSDDSGD